MTRIGVTGHQDLAEVTQELVAAEMERRLPPGPLVGISSLAAGADQLFARIVLRRRGRLEAIIPAADYEETFAKRSDLDRYRKLYAAATEVVALDFAHASEEAYWAAGQEVVRRSDALLAVWDGADAAGLGGTGDVVRYARESGTPVTVIWPSGARRG